MSKETHTLDAMLDYVHQLKRHTEGRWALHIKLSSLERHMQEPYYRREVAAALRPLVAHKGTKIFSLPNADSIVVTGPAKLDDIAPTVADIRKKLRDSDFMATYDPLVGISDHFIEWFDLETDYADFEIYAQEAARKARQPADQQLPEVSKPTKKVAKIPSKLGDSIAPGKSEYRKLDAFTLAAAMRKLPHADVSEALRQQRVVAVVGNQKPTPVLIHKYVDIGALLEKLTNITVSDYDRWLEGHFAEEIAMKLLDAQPDLSNKGSMASSIRLTCASVVSPSFDRFDAALSAAGRSALVIEFSLIDVLTSPRSYEAAYQKIKKRGYKVALADVEPESLLWFDHEKLHATFLKLSKPADVKADWMPHELEQAVAARINQIGRARVILDGCQTEQDVLLGQQLGITLFQGRFTD